MKCGNCKLWKINKINRRRQYMIFGKALGWCTYKGNKYPTFNFEKCPFVDRNC